jgi:signal transduction histidine kinase
MIFFAIRSAVLLFAIGLSMVLAVVTVLRRKNPINYAFAAWSLILSGYVTVVYLAVNSNSDLEAARRWILASGLMIFMVASGLCFFSCTFRFSGFQWNWLWKFGASFLVCSGVVAWLLPRVLGDSPVMRGPWNPIANYVNPWWPLFFVPVSWMCFCGIYNFYLTWRNVTGYKRAQLQYGFAGVLLYWMLGLCIGFLLPSLGYQQAQGFSAAFSVTVTAPIAYAIIAYRLFDISVLGRRLLNVMANTLILGGGSVLALFVCSRFLEQPDSLFRRETALFVVTLGVVTSIFYGVVRGWVQRGIYNLHRRAPNSRELLGERLAELLRSIEEIDPLLKQVLEIVCGGMEISHGEIYVRAPDRAFRREAVNGAFPEEELPLPRVIDVFEQGRDLLLQHELIQQGEMGDADLLRELREAEIELALPIREREQLVGVLCLGPKFSGDIYSRQDQRFFMAVASQLGIAIENASLYSRVQQEKVYQKTILDNLPSGVFSVDLGHRITSANRSAQEILRRSTFELMGCQVAAVDPSFAELVNETLHRERTVLRREIVYRPSHRSEGVPLEASSLVLRGVDGHAIGCLLIVTDQSRIKQMEQEVRLGERLAAVGRMAASVAHEIKNPLVSIKTFAQLLPERYGDDEFRTSFSVLADQEIDRINSLVEHLLDLVRPSVVRREEVELVRILEDVLALTSVECSQKQLEVVRENWDTPSWVLGDPEKLKQVFVNLVQNAIQAMDPAGTLTLSLSLYRGIPPAGSKEELLHISPSGTIVVGVADTGRGIAPNLLETIFEPFFTTKEGGTGLGLSISHKIVTDHGGKMLVESREGAGTRFTVALPCMQTGRAR